MQTENGPKRIEDVQVGEKVWSWREESGEIVLSEVVETFVRADQPLLAVTIGAASTAQETIKSTTEHPYWTQRGWTPAQELTTADQVLSRSGEWLSVLSVTELAEKSTVYNFEVKGSHSYFVGEQGVLVHNVSRMNRAAPRAINRAKAFDKAGIETTEHFRNRLVQRAGRGITEVDALDAYRNGRLYYNEATGTYIRHASRTGVSVVTDAPTGGRAITVFEGNPSPGWNPVPWRPGQ